MQTKCSFGRCTKYVFLHVAGKKVTLRILWKTDVVVKDATNAVLLPLSFIPSNAQPSLLSHQPWNY